MRQEALQASLSRWKLIRLVFHGDWLEYTCIDIHRLDAYCDVMNHPIQIQVQKPHQPLWFMVPGRKKLPELTILSHGFNSGPANAPLLSPC